jgi:hypothetical protein
MKIELENQDVIAAITQYVQAKFNSQSVVVSDIALVAGRKGNGYSATADVSFEPVQLEMSFTEKFEVPATILKREVEQVVVKEEAVKEVVSMSAANIFG